MSQTKAVTLRLIMESSTATPATSATRAELEAALVEAFSQTKLCCWADTELGGRQEWITTAAEIVGR